jgi:hypothetical protein
MRYPTCSTRILPNAPVFAALSIAQKELFIPLIGKRPIFDYDLA